MTTYLTDQTLKGFMDIYAHEVVSLRSREEHNLHEIDRLRRAEKELEESKKDAEKVAGEYIVELRAERKRAQKQDDIIKSLTIELQDAREAHTRTGEGLANCHRLIGEIWEIITHDGTEEAKVIAVHQAIVAARAGSKEDSDD